MILRGIYSGCKCPGQYSSRAIIRREIIWGTITQVLIVQGATFPRDNYPGSNNPRGNHPGGNCLWGNHPGGQLSETAIFLGDNYHRRQFSGRVIIRRSINQGQWTGVGGNYLENNFLRGKFSGYRFCQLRIFSSYCSFTF